MAPLSYRWGSGSRLWVIAIAALLAAMLLPAPAGARTTVLGPGAWSYFGDPRAVHVGGRTFVGYTDTDGYIRLSELEDGHLVRQRRLGPQMRVDDHRNPSIYVEPDGRLTFYY